MNTSTKSQLGGLQAWFNWLLGVAFVVFVFTFQTGYAITNINMTKDLSLTVAQVGFIGSIYTWAFAFAQFGSGSILDRLGFRWVLPIASAVVTLGGFVFGRFQREYSQYSSLKVQLHTSSAREVSTNDFVDKMRKIMATAHVESELFPFPEINSRKM